jgi:hypothetical protein
LRDKLFEGQAVKTYSGGKPNYTQPDEAMMKRVMDGIPDMPIKVQDEREENYKSFAQSAQVIGGQYDPRRKPSGSWTSWDNTMCNPLANARMQTQSAWQDGYDSAKAEEKEMSEPVAYINVEKRELEWATLIKWETPTVVKMDKVPLYAAPQKYAPSENNRAYERGYIDGQQKQIELAVHKAVKRMGERDWHELTDNEIAAIKNKYGFGVNIFSFRSAVRELETWLKERNNG